MELEDGTVEVVQGKLPLFRNFSNGLDRLSRPRTILIDSAAIEAGGDIDPAFKEEHATEIRAFRAETARRVGQAEADKLTDGDILRELLNTVGKKDKLGEQVRCVVSVSMLTEGWDANTVTHILGLRAFGTKLICELVMGRALRRLSYDLSEDGLFPVEYADILGIDGLNFSGQPIVSKPKAPRETIHVRSVSPERDHLEIVFPRVQGYRLDFPDERLEVDFTKIEPYVLTTEKVGPSQVTMSGIVERIQLSSGAPASRFCTSGSVGSAPRRRGNLRPHRPYRAIPRSCGGRSTSAQRGLRPRLRPHRLQPSAGHRRQGIDDPELSLRRGGCGRCGRLRPYVVGGREEKGRQDAC